MSVVRVHPERARDLVERYASAGQDIRQCMTELSPLVSQALALLDQPGQHPLYGPLPALTTAANDLAADGRDVDWRLDMILAGDARPMGMSGILRLDNAGPVVDNPNVDLVDALIAAGLTPVQAQNARWAIVDGASFGDAVEQERQRVWADNMAAFRRMEAEAWTERSPVDQARYSLDQIRVILDTARQDRDDGDGIGYGGDRDGVWSTNDLRAVIDNDHGFYTQTQIEHARTVLAMAESSPEAREVLGITESGGGWSFADIGHLTLDVVGMVPVVGNAADAANAAWYASEGDYLNAALSSLGMIPAIGQAVIAAKPVIIAASAGIVFKSLDEALAWARRWLDDAGILARGSDEAVDGVMATARGVNGTPIPRTATDAEDLRIALDHLDTVDGLDVAHQQAMVDAIQRNVDNGVELTAAQRNFLDHELLEAQYVANGMDQWDAHELVLEDIPVGANFDPEVLIEYSEWFSQPYFDYWGMTKP